MQKAPIPPNENERLKAVMDLGMLDTEQEKRFDRITKAVMEEFSVPISTITIIDKDREWFKSMQGIENRQGPRETSFCGHAMFAKDIFIVEDTLQDERFKDNPQVIGKPFIRFYAGVALYYKNQAVGVLCIKDNKPRKFSAEDINKLLDFAKLVEEEFLEPEPNLKQ